MKKQISIPTGMLLKKYYCHKCGNKLEKLSYTNTIAPGDPDYLKYSYTRIGGKHRFTFGKIEHTEIRNFMCPHCNEIILYDEQKIIAKVQKQLDKHILAEFELQANREKAEASIRRNGILLKVLSGVATVVIVALALYFGTKYGIISFGFYL